MSIRVIRGKNSAPKMSTRLLRFTLFVIATGVFSTAADASRTVSLVVDASAGQPAQHGAEKLSAALAARGWSVQAPASPEAATGAIAVTARIDTGRTAEALAHSVLAIVQGAFVIALSARDPEALAAAGETIALVIDPSC